MSLSKLTQQQVEQRINNDAQRARAMVDGKRFETKAPEDVNDLLARGKSYFVLGKFAEALADLKEAVKRDPSLGAKGGFAQLAEISRRLKDNAGVLSYLKQWIEASPEAPVALNAYAWELLTNADAGLRNPKLALQHAEKCNELTNNPNPQFLDTLALAYFNTGKLQAALATEEKAVRLLPPSFPAPERKEYEDRLRQFRDALLK
jgi:tetratricopeptide (TPR) repeat protein